LAEFEERLARAEDAVFETTSGPIADFIAFVWWAAAEQEKAGERVERNFVEDLLSRTLGWIQTEDVSRGRWVNAAHATLNRFQAADPVARRRWATTGTSIPSAHVLDEIATELMEELQDGGVPEGVAATLALLLSDGRVDRLLALPEAPKRKAYRYRSAARADAIEINLLPLLADWIAGADLAELADRYLPMVRDVDFRFEQLGDILYDYFEYFLPWALSSLITSTNTRLAAADDVGEQALPADLPAYVRWGVGSRPALLLLTGGLRSRQLALRIAAVYEQQVTPLAVKPWVCRKGISDWQRQFHTSLAELRDLMDFCRERHDDVASRLLAGQTTRLQVDTTLDDHEATPARLRGYDAPGVQPIEILFDDEVVGVVPTRYQSDLQGLLRAGLSLDAALETNNRETELILTLRTEDPD
jgi:hypothetical protein